jgi:hypothetical protein
MRCIYTDNEWSKPAAVNKYISCEKKVLASKTPSVAFQQKSTK